MIDPMELAKNMDYLNRSATHPWFQQAATALRLMAEECAAWRRVDDIAHHRYADGERGAVDAARAAKAKSDALGIVLPSRAGEGG